MCELCRFVVESALDDVHTLANPLVTGQLGLRFYAAGALKTSDGFNLGTLCVVDKKPRYFSAEQQAMLPRLAERDGEDGASLGT